MFYTLVILVDDGPENIALGFDELRVGRDFGRDADKDDAWEERWIGE